MDDPFESIFVPIILDLQEVLGDLVVIGGWVPELHRRFGIPGEWGVNPLATTEVDILLGGPHDSNGSHRRLAETLEKAGFSPVGSEGTSAVWERETSRYRRLGVFPAPPTRAGQRRWEGVGQPGSPPATQHR